MHGRVAVIYYSATGNVHALSAPSATACARRRAASAARPAAPGSCCAAEPVGALHLFPHCDNALMTMVEADTHAWIGFPGIRTLQVSL